MNWGLDTRLRRLERNAPDPYEAGAKALPKEELRAAFAAVQETRAGQEPCHL